MNKSTFQRLLLHLLSIFLVLLFIAASPAYSASALWIAESDGVLKLATADGTMLLEIPDAGGVESVAIDADQGRVWTYSGGSHKKDKPTLRAYTVDGELETDVAVPIIHQHAKPVDMVADAGGVWLAIDRDAYRFNAQGVLQKRIHFRRPINSLTLDTERSSIWIAVPGHVFVLDDQGQDIGRFRTHFPFITQLEYDAFLDATWVVVGPYLLRLGADDRDLQFVSRFGVGFKLWRHLSADGHGGVWGADPSRLTHVNASGEIEFTFTPFQGYRGKRTLQDLIADPEDGSVWLTNRMALKQYSLVGSQQKELTPDLGDGIIRSINRMALSAQTRPPQLNIVFPAINSFISTNTPTIELQYRSDGTIDPDSIEIKHHDSVLMADCTANQADAQCTLSGALPEGEVTLDVTVANTDGNVSEPAQVTFTVDTMTPVIAVTNPENGLVTNTAQLALGGSVSEAVQTLTLDHDGKLSSLQISGDNVFSRNITLAEGDNMLVLTAVDMAGNSGSTGLTVTLDTSAPHTPDLQSITISLLDENGNVNVTGTANSVEPHSRVTIINVRTGESVVVIADANGAFTASIAAETGDSIQMTATDAAGNVSESADSEVRGNNSELPPDPSTVAPPLNPTQITPMLEATAFLYTGNNPIQTGVQPGTIEARRVAVIRGKVFDRQSNPLPGVTVTVKSHPEFGQTLSRADGMFDLVVNGGGVLTLDYEKKDYLSVQRQVNAPWRDYIFADDIVMIPLDPQVTMIDLANPTMQIAQGTPQADEDGTRQATILFPPGTTAIMTLSDGAQQALTTLHVRATEYTVGENGFEAMPAKLPPTSGYTYAVELSVDEAIAADASKVTFNQPIPLYVDNFLDFPTGEAVPVGYYDRERAVWVPSKNGRVIEILSVDNGLAVLDVEGDGNPADQARLEALGITDVERRQLGDLYQPGKTLWRSPITHFTPWDCNWPFGPPQDAVAPLVEKPKVPDGELPDDSGDENMCPGCDISPQAQTAGEKIPIVGTPYSLHYRSDRVPGRKARSTIDIPITADSIPSSLESLELSINIAGRRIEEAFGPQPDLSYIFEWDGLDGFGRTVYGSVSANIKITYIYPCEYRPANGFAQSGSSAEIIGTRGSCQSFALSRHWDVKLESPWTPVNVVGNWSLSVYHFLDYGRFRLFKGDGQHRTIGSIIETVAGNGQSGFSNDNGFATEAKLSSPLSIATDAKGNLYIADTNNNRIRRVDPSGMITTIAGSGICCALGDGGLATEAWLDHPKGVAVDSAGNAYIADTSNARIRKVDINGIITTIAGGGADYDSNNIPATEALVSPLSVAVSVTGDIYYSDTSRVRKINTNGMVSTVAGTGEFGFSGDGGLATMAQLSVPQGIALDKKGNLYIADTGNSGAYSGNQRIRRVSVDGVITTVAGGFCSNFPGDGGLAVDACIGAPSGIAVDEAGNLYIADTTYNHVRKVTPDGVITTLAGAGTDLINIGTFAGDGGAPNQAKLNRPSDVALDEVGNIYIADSFNNRIRRILNANPDSGIVTSKDGVRQYIFNNGRHLYTISSLTGAMKYKFGHDNQGRLVTITDADGGVAVIERDANGKATSIVSPDGQRTELTVDANRHLVAVTNPAGEMYRMQYAPDGLLTEFRNPRNQPDTFQYDDLGRLTQNVNAGFGGWTLDRTELSEGYQALMTSAEGRTLTFTVEPQPNGDRKQANTRADGTVLTRLFKTDGVEITTEPDGTIIAVQESPDPRFGMQAPVPENLTVKTPGGLTFTANTVREVSLEDPADPLSLQSLTETTTANGNVFTSIYDAATKTFTVTSPEGRTSIETINDQGRPVHTQTTGLATEDFGYDNRGRLETVLEDDGSEQRLTQFSYYGSGPQTGFLKSITDPASRTTSFEYDSTGRVIKQTLPDSREVQYQYDANGNLTSIAPPGRPAHVFNYNAFDLGDTYTPPVVAGVANSATIYDYNLDKELERVTRPDGRTVNFNYNNKAQLTSIAISRGTYTYSYNTTTGQLSSLTTPDGGTLAYDYDGFLLTGQSWTGDINGNVTWNYNNNFLVSQRCVNVSDCISLDYDNDNMLTNAGNLNIARDSQRNGLITGTALGNITTSQDYNTFGELESLDAKYLDAQYFQTQYLRDGLGRIRQKVETVQSQTVTEIYGYDQAGRLETVNRDGTLTTYAYDSNGNRLSKITGNVTESGTYDDQDRLLAYDGCSYEYTENGELKTKTCGSDITTYSYDVFANLISVSLPDGADIEYVIDGQNRRIGKKVNGSLAQGFLYTGQLNLIAELDPNGNIRSRFVYADKINVPSYMVRDGVTYRIVSDHLGSPRLVIDTTDGSVAQRMDYDEFGIVVNDTNPGFQPFGFAGGIYDPSTGLTRFGARDYDAQTGRWTAKDSIGFLGGSTGLYSYASSDPVNLIDPTGLYCFSDRFINAVAGGVGGAFSGLITGLQTGNLYAAAGGALLGGLFGAGFGYYGTSSSGQAIVSGIGSSVSSTFTTPGGSIVGGTLGGALSYELQSAGLRDSHAGIIAGAAGGFAGGSFSGFISNTAFRSGIRGGLAGLAGAALSAAITETLRAGNNCCGNEK